MSKNVQAQCDLPFEPAVVGHGAWLLQLEWVKRIVATLTAKEVTFALGIKDSTLSDALAERKAEDQKGKKAIKAEWIAILLAMANDEQRGEYLRLVATPLNYVIARPVKSPEEELREMRAHFKREAPGVLRDFEKNR